MTRESFVFYRSFYEAFDEIPDEVFCDVMRSLCAYALDGVEPNLKGVSLMAWRLIKPQLDANNRRYENGKKGGRPKTNGSEKEKPVVTEIKTTGYESDNHRLGKSKPNDNDNVNVNENVNVNDNDNGGGLLSRLSKEDYNRIYSTYTNAIELLDLADESSQGKTINNPYRYVVGIAENRNWERNLNK